MVEIIKRCNGKKDRVEMTWQKYPSVLFFHNIKSSQVLSVSSHCIITDTRPTMLKRGDKCLAFLSFIDFSGIRYQQQGSFSPTLDIVVNNLEYW